MYFTVMPVGVIIRSERGRTPQPVQMGGTVEEGGGIYVKEVS